MATPHHLPKKRGALKSTPKISLFKRQFPRSLIACDNNHTPKNFSLYKNAHYKKKKFITMKKIITIVSESLQKLMISITIKIEVIGLWNKNFCYNKLLIFYWKLWCNDIFVIVINNLLFWISCNNRLLLHEFYQLTKIIRVKLLQ